MNARRLAAAFALLATSAFACFACVDLFHSTDFETLCTKDPPDPSCSGDAAPVDAAAEAASDAEPPLDLCSLDGKTAQSLAEHACAWLGACEGPLDSSRFGPCVAHARFMMDCKANPGRRPHGAMESLFQCLAKAESCAAVDACIFPGGVPPCPAIDAGRFTTCSDTVRVECAASGPPGRPSSVEPCVAQAETCKRLDNATSHCAGAHSEKCPGPDTCAGTSLVTCSTSAGLSTVDVGYDCALVGDGQCVMLDSTHPACAASKGEQAMACGGYTGVGCTGGGQAAATATACIADHLVTIDCSATGARCNGDAGSPAFLEGACADPPPLTTPCTGEDTCSGTTLTSCSASVKRTIDCASVGLGKCVVQNGYAKCSPP